MINNIFINKSIHEDIPDICLIKNGTVLDPHDDKEFVSDIKIEKGIITEISENIKEEDGWVVIDATGKYVTQGFLDMHVHLRDPGYEQAENIITGTNAAICGGFTSILAMPNTTPCVDNIFIYNDIKRRADNLLVTVHQAPAVTIGREGEILVEMAEFNDCGALAFTDDGNGIQKSETMKGALEYSSMFKTPILVHAEDSSFINGVMNESLTSTELGMAGTPNIAESCMIARDISIARYVNGNPHFQHVSAGESVELIRNAKKEGLKVTAEVTPHHFSLSDEKVKTFSTDYKMNPPLRTSEDIDAILEGLRDGTIDVIASDHAPHTHEKKNVEFDYAPFGVLGLETLFPAGIKYLVKTGILPLSEFIKKITVNPRNILNLETDILKVGNKAEITIFDTETEWTVNRRELQSRSLNTCYHGEQFTGKIHTVINNQKVFINK